MSRLVGGRYRLERFVGDGAHAEVWRARDELGGDEVAVKLMRRGGLGARARREIALLRMLRIPGVVRMVDDGVDDDQVFLVTELVEGTPFPGRATPAPWVDIAQTTYALLEALARVHAAGIVHRDLKPANVLVTPEGRPIVLDFGVAFVGADDRLTIDGEIVGTPAYLAPEQIRGDRVTPTADLYAVGVMLYEALTGSLPHPGRDAAEIMRARLLRPPPTLAPSITTPAATADAVRRLLETDELRRPQDAGDVLARLQGRVEERVAWLGPRDAIERTVDLLCSGRSVVLNGGGNERATEEVVRGVDARRVRVVQLPTSDEPFASLAPLLGDELSSLPKGAALNDVEARVDDVLRNVERAVLCVGGIDEASRSALEKTTLPVLSRAPWRNATVVTIAPLAHSDLERLFVGSNRVHHLPEDAAQVLVRRTGGDRELVERELARWTRAGRCQWDRGRIHLTREALDRIEADPVAIEAPRAELDARLDARLLVAELVDDALDARVLAEVFQCPLWAAESDLRSLRTSGALSANGRPLRRSLASAEQRRSLQARVAEVLPVSANRLRAFIESTENWSAAASERLVGEAILLARKLVAEGATTKATAILRETLGLVRATGASTEQRVRLLEAWIGIDADDAAGTTLDRMLYELHREPATSVGHMIALVRATGELQKWGNRPSEAAERIPPFEDRGLEYRRLALRVLAARSAAPEHEERVIGEVVAMAARTNDDELRSRAKSWLGKLRYRQGRYDEAAQLHLDASQHVASRTERIATMIHAASALQEAFRHDEALKLACDARAEAAACRHAYLEARAEWMVRSVEYRLGRTHRVDHELLAAIRSLGAPHLVSLVTFVEATHAFRAGDASVGALASEALAGWTRAGDPLGVLLAGSLAAAVGCLGSTDRDALCESAWTSDVPGVGLQAAALLAAGGAPRPNVTVVETLSATVAKHHWSRRMELLSVDEARERLSA